MSKTVLITGATDGIGFATAKKLLDLGMRVLVHGRSESKAKSAIARLGKLTDVNLALPVAADFERMNNVVELARQVRTTTESLDILINNAGIYPKKRRVTDDGLELTMAINYFAPFLLTRELIGLISQNPTARVVNVSSMTHQSASLDIDDLDLRHNWDAYSAYAISKLCNVLFTNELAKRSMGTGLTTNALHPGVVGTKLLRQGFSMGGISCEDGAKTSVYLATSHEIDGVSGKYFENCRPNTASSVARNPSLASALWRETEARLAAILMTN